MPADSHHFIISYSCLDGPCRRIQRVTTDDSIDRAGPDDARGGLDARPHRQPVNALEDRIVDLAHFRIPEVWAHGVDPLNQPEPAGLVDLDAIVLAAGDQLDEME